MAFRNMMIETERKESGQLRGRVVPIACKAWFTASGTPQPLSFKFETADGSLQSVQPIQTRLVEDKCFSGIPSKECSCEAVINGTLCAFKLIFYTETCRWVLQQTQIMV